MEDQCKVLTNVPIGSTPFLFQVCRMIPGTKPPNSWRAAAVLSIPVIGIEMTGQRGSSVSKSSVSILREGSVFRTWCEKWRGTCKLICGQSYVRCTVLAPQLAFQHFRNGIPPLIGSNLALTRLHINRKGDSSAADCPCNLEWLSAHRTWNDINMNYKNMDARRFRQYDIVTYESTTCRFKSFHNLNHDFVSLCLINTCTSNAYINLYNFN